MDGLCRAIGAETLIELGDREYVIAPLTLGDLGLVENVLVLARRLPTDAVRGMVAATESPELRQRLIAQARRELKADVKQRIVTADEFEGFVYSDAGIALTAWLSLRRWHSADVPSRAAAGELLGKATDEQRIAFVRARDAISGLGLLNAFDWPQEEDMVRPEVLARRRARAAQTYRLMPWRANLRAWAEEAGVSVESARGWTLYQYRMMCVDRKELGSPTAENGKRRRATAEQAPIVISNDGSWRGKIGDAGAGADHAK